VTDHHDGQRVSRRSLVRGVAALGFGGVLAACSRESGGTPVGDLGALFASANLCTLTESATRGPYYFDADRVRADIREDRPGTRLRLAFKVVDVDGCTPIENAVVEIWHCDANGLYSGAESLSSGGGGEGMPPSGGPPPGGSGARAGGSGAPAGGSGAPAGGSGAPPAGGAGGSAGDADLTPTDDRRYLRGAQVTGADGIVQFVTIWPGWYRGRTVHVHVMVHVANDRALTSQLMFLEELNATVFSRAPYDARTGRETFNSSDSIYRKSMLASVAEEGDGYVGAIVLGLA
jgi:protocatechuate 3,4-dioxygenase beta subunit